MIVGAAGSPYHDGLFFFNVAFPHDYPTHTPERSITAPTGSPSSLTYTTTATCAHLINTWVRCFNFSQTDAERYLKMETSNVLSKKMGHVTNRKYRVIVSKVIGKIRKLYTSKLKADGKN